ncbi:unnamed protein product [Soboliphyme baturini]|uniref:Homeobox domain-containing protein n=1 Tax=Soboliphyme baturini TaxID=241478 RepID=A0A183IIM5_9BILA|nr:unnamed protein product [Soboliphyme baturini]
MSRKDFRVETILGEPDKQRCPRRRAFLPRPTADASEIDNPKSQSTAEYCWSPYDDKLEDATVKKGSSIRKRRAFGENQVFVLEREFQKRRYITSEQRQKLSQMINLTEQQIKIWFQNRRYKIKRRNPTEPNGIGTFDKRRIPVVVLIKDGVRLNGSHVSKTISQSVPPINWYSYKDGDQK